MNRKIKNPVACPFCDGKYVTVHEYDSKDYWWCVCDNIHCGAEGPPRKARYEAIRAWNKARKR